MVIARGEYIAKNVNLWPPALNLWPLAIKQKKTKPLVNFWPHEQAISGPYPNKVTIFGPYPNKV